MRGEINNCSISREGSHLSNERLADDDSSKAALQWLASTLESLGFDTFRLGGEGVLATLNGPEVKVCSPRCSP